MLGAVNASETPIADKPSGQEPPRLLTRPPGPESRSRAIRHAHVAAPMGPSAPAREGSTPTKPAFPVVLAHGAGSNVSDVDGNRYVDLAGGFGSLLIGHGHPSVLRMVQFQSQRLLQALGDVYPSEPKIALMEQLTELYPQPAQVLLGQSGSDALSAALKTAVLHTGRPGVLAFSGAYHGLGYGPLAACGLRPSYRQPFVHQLNGHVRFLDYPASSTTLGAVLDATLQELSEGQVGAVLVEPILGRGGVLVPPTEFLPELARLCALHGALLVADEVWTGLGRAGSMLSSTSGCLPDLICLGKGLGGGLPISALVGRREVMQSWRQPAEVVHTATFAGAPLACASALATLDVLRRERLPERAHELGGRFRQALSAAVSTHPLVPGVRGAGLMLGIDLAARPGAGAALAQRLLERGYITSTGGGEREVLVLTPPLNIAEDLLLGFVPALCEALDELARMPGFEATAATRQP